MIKAVVDFVEDGHTVKAGEEIKPGTLSSDTLLGPLFKKGWILEIEPEVNDQPAPKTGKTKGSKAKE